MTPTQCKEARKLLGWSQDDLAVAAEIGVIAIIRFERSGRVAKRKAGGDYLGMIQGTFEVCRVEFGPTNVRLRVADT